VTWERFLEEMFVIVRWARDTRRLTRIEHREASEAVQQATQQAREAPWGPRVEFLEREGQLVIHADLPGMTKDDVKIEVTDEAITIQGERKEEKKGENKGYLYNEVRYGSFYRTLPLPEGAEPFKATAELHDGVLEVIMPVPEHPEKKSRRVEVKRKQFG